MKNFYTSEILVLPNEFDVLEGEEKILAIKSQVRNYLANKKEFSICKNLFYFNQECANFPIEEVRKIQVEASYSPSFGNQDNGQDKRVFILCNFDSASNAAQNAALKIIEESPQNTLILLLVTKKEKILETIISRCLTIQLEQTINKQKQESNLTNFVWPKNYSQAIDLAQENKDRNKAISLMTNLLKIKNLETKKKQILLRSYQDLNRNQNVQLTLENCFFSLVSLES